MTKDSGRTRAPSEGQPDTLLQLLREAYAPEPLDNATNDRLIDRALGDTLERLDAPDEAAAVEFAPSRGTPESFDVMGIDELAEAERLASALEGDGHHPLAELAEALKLARDPPAAAQVLIENLAHSVVRQLDLNRTNASASRIRGRVWSFATAAVALAAGLALWIGRVSELPSPRQDTFAEPMVLSRSVAPLFVETIAPANTTERIDRIYAVRSRELRQNRYTSWRVR